MGTLHALARASDVSNFYSSANCGAGKAAEEVGINFILKKFPAEITQEELIKEVRALNDDESVHGFVIYTASSFHVFLC